MTMDDDLAERPIPQQELVPDPEKVFLGLLVERSLRANSGVNEQVRPDFLAQFQSLQERSVPIREAGGEFPLGFLEPLFLGFQPDREMHTIADQRGIAAY